MSLFLKEVYLLNEIYLLKIKITSSVRVTWVTAVKRSLDLIQRDRSVNDEEILEADHESCDESIFKLRSKMKFSRRSF